MQRTALCTFALYAALASAAQGPWQQCGGINWTGGTTCISGWTCVPQANNPYYSQCLQVSNAVSSPAQPAPPATTKAATPPPATSSPASSGGGSSGQSLKASFTFYGAGDTFGSPNCNTNTAACGFFTSPGFSAAASQNLFGVGPGAGAGPACGTCWKLTGQTDSSGNALSNAGTSIIVMVNNLCPAQGNPLCAQNGLTGTNQYGANVNFDLCADSGAKAAFFGNDGVGLALGTATQVSCSEYSGTVVH